MRKLYLLKALLVTCLFGIWGGSLSAQTEVTIWEEDWTGIAAETKVENVNSMYTASNSKTRVYNDNLAKGTKPELLLQKSDTWVVTITELKGCSGELELTLYNNNGEFTVTANNVIVNLTADVNVYTGTVNLNGETSLDLKFKASKNTRLDNLKLTRTTLAEGELAAPTITGTTPFEGSTTVTLEAEEGATIYYTTNGIDPTIGSEGLEEYSQPFTILETTTVKAIAVKDGKESAVATKEFTKTIVYNNLSTLVTQIKQDNVTSSSNALTYRVNLTNAIVTGVQGNHVFLEEDGTGVYYNKSGHGLIVGQSYSGAATVTAYMNNGNPRWSSFTGATATPDATVPCTDITIADLNTNFDRYLGRRIRVTDVDVISAFSSRSATIKKDDAEIIAYDLGNQSLSLSTTAKATITGFVYAYNKTKEIAVLSQDDIEQAGVIVPPTEPTISLAAGSYIGAQTVELTTTSEDAVIYYTLDGNAPDKNSILYDAATKVTIDKNCTLKAVAYNPTTEAYSDVVSASYTIVTIVNNGTFEKPYTASEYKALKNKGALTTEDDVWVVGQILGSMSNSGPVTENYSDASLVIGENAENYVSIQLASNSNLKAALNVKDTPANIGKTVRIYGSVDNYFGVPGIKSITRAYGLWSMKIANGDNYGTYYNTYAYEMPVGLQGAIITNVDNGILTVDYKYQAGERVPNKSALMINGEAGEYGYVVVNSTATAASNNMLHGADAVDADGKTFVEGTDVKYYILTSSATKKLGFYWAAANGAAVTYQAPYAFLAIDGGAAVNGLFFGGETTGIEGVETENDTQVIFDLSGRRVQKAQKGIYIVNGKKVLVK